VLYQNPQKGLGGVAKTKYYKYFLKKMKSRGHNSLKNNWTRLSLQYANIHNVIFLCSKFQQNPPKGLGGVAKTK
jgi:hypothetical protein